MPPSPPQFIPIKVSVLNRKRTYGIANIDYFACLQPPFVKRRTRCPPRKRERRDRGGEEGHIRESEHGLLVKIEAPPQQKHIVCRKGEGERSNGDDGREERREGQRCERDGRCGGWLAREIMERWRAEKLEKVKEAR